MKHHVSEAMQDYLKAIETQGGSSPVSTTVLSDYLGVKPSSVTSMFRKLSQLGLVEYRRHRGVVLTKAGRSIALEVIRHHRLLELWLERFMGYTWDKVHVEAETLEHHISENFENIISQQLGEPEYDPHGDPIPNVDGEVPRSFTERLRDVAAGDSVFVRRVCDKDAGMLLRLTAAGIAIHTRLCVKGWSKGGEMIVATDTKPVRISDSDAAHIYVEREQVSP